MRCETHPVPGFFPDDYPAVPVEALSDTTRWAIRRQVAQLRDAVRDPALQRVAFEDLRVRRADAPPEVVRIDALSDPGRPDTLIAQGEVLISSSAPKLGEVIAFLEGQGLEQADVGCPELAGAIVRLVTPADGDPDPVRLDDLGRVLRRRGVAASVNHLTPLAKPVGKAEGGAEPVQGPGDFPLGRPGADVGAGITVAVIDTGITAEDRSDRWLTGIDRVPDGAGGKDRPNVDPLDAFPPGDPNHYLDYAAGHGTFAAGIVQQVAPGATVRAYRALDSDGVGTEIGVACAMVQAVKDGADILNLSLGGQARDDIPPVAMVAALDRIAQLEREQERKVLLVAAAGNYGDTVPCWPAAFRRVVSVAALGPDGRPADWSSRGWWVTCSVVGEGVRSTYVEGVESPDADPEPDTFPLNAWAVWSGTSFAAPQVAGAVARLAQADGVPVHQALGSFLQQGLRVPDFGVALRILPGT